MPHVASDWKSQALNRLLQQTGKQGYTSASQKTTPFDSILDETSRPTAEPQMQRTANDTPPRAERGQRTKPADRPDRSAKADDKAKPSDADAPAKADAAADTAKTDDAGTKTTDAKATDTKSVDTTSDDKVSDPTITVDDTTAAADATQQPDTKPADPVAVMPVAVVIDPAATLSQTPTTANAKGEAKVESTAVVATAATAAPAATTAMAATDATKAIATAAVDPATAAAATDETTPKTTGAPAATAAATAVPATATATPAPKVTAVSGQADVAAVDVNAEAALAQAQPNTLATLGAKTDKTEKTDKADIKSDKKAEADKKAAPAQTTLKPTVALDPKAAQAANDEPEKNTGAHAHAEATANSHRGVIADTATAAATPDATITAKSPDLTPPPGLTVQAPAHAAQAAAAAIVAPTAILRSDSSEPAVPIAGVAFEITSKALSGRNQFDIRLDPPDLGRIHVRLDVDRDGNVITHMVADRTDTLDLLRKDTAGLERALQDAGLKTSDNSLQFSLRDQQANQQQRNDRGESAHVVIEDEQLAAIEPAQRNYARYNTSTGGLDIRV